MKVAISVSNVLVNVIANKILTAYNKAVDGLEDGFVFPNGLVRTSPNTLIYETGTGSGVYTFDGIQNKIFFEGGRRSFLSGTEFFQIWDDQIQIFDFPEVEKVEVEMNFEVEVSGYFSSMVLERKTKNGYPCFREATEKEIEVAQNEQRRISKKERKDIEKYILGKTKDAVLRNKLKDYLDDREYIVWIGENGYRAYPDDIKKEVDLFFNQEVEIIRSQK